MDNQESGKKKFYKRWWFWVGAVVVLFVIIGISGSSTPSASVPAPDESGTVAQQTQATPQQPAVTTHMTQKSVPAAAESQPAPAPTQPVSKPAPAPAAMQTLLDVSGSGSKTTESFTAAGAWNLIWSYDCSNFGSKGNFQVFIYDGNGNISFDNSGVNQLGASGSDTDYYHVGGTYYLEVNSECSWHIQVKG